MLLHAFVSFSQIIILGKKNGSEEDSDSDSTKDTHRNQAASGGATSTPLGKQPQKEPKGTFFISSFRLKYLYYLVFFVDTKRSASKTLKVQFRYPGEIQGTEAVRGVLSTRHFSREFPLLIKSNYSTIVTSTPQDSLEIALEVLDVVYKAKGDLGAPTASFPDFDCRDAFVVAEITDKDDLVLPTAMRGGEENRAFIGCAVVHKSRKLVDVLNVLKDAGTAFFFHFFFFSFFFVLLIRNYFLKLNIYLNV